MPAGWKFFSAKDSHERTEERWSESGLKLTGEAAGRQSWDRTDAGDKPSPDYADEALMFNPAVNPNSGDKVVRAQQARQSLHYSSFRVH